MLPVPAFWMLLACVSAGSPSGVSVPLSEPRSLTEPRSTLEMAHSLTTDPASLGALSLGRPNHGALVNAAQMASSDDWEVVSPSTAWATAETIRYLERAITHTAKLHPGAHRLHIGDMSREHGGPIRPHRSHQSGRDVDLGYYYLPGSEGWYQLASERTLDRSRSWALVRAFVTETDVELILIDQRVQRMLYDEALASGEDMAWLDSIFGFRKKHPEPLIRHAYGHRTHLHVRFYNPRAQSLGSQASEALAIRGLVPATKAVGSLARKNGTRNKPAPGSREDLLARLRAAMPKNVVTRVSAAVVPPRRLPPAYPGAIAAARATLQQAPAR
ncbi:MAG: hypothetical protein EXR75_17230 [Myxococcales bacterium]|nr:hypothetical protein [Myxococcales bacterium]